MATVSGSNVVLSNGSIVTPQQGGWYDGQQYYNGTLSNPGQINSQSSQQGAGQQVSSAVVAQTNPANNAYIQQQQQAGVTGTPGGNNTAPTNPGATSTGSTTGGTGVAGLFGGGSGSSTLDLQGASDALNQQYNVKGLQDQITAQQTAFNDASSKINDNPFLSEADRVGRISKLTTDYNNSVQTTQDALTMAQADVTAALNIKTQQFNIDSQQTQQNLSEFNTLLSSGALTNASGADIAAITNATGLPSDIIQSAISSAAAKNVPTAVQMVDDGTNQYAVTINTQTGAVISKTVLAASAPKTTGTGKVDANGLTTTDYTNYLMNDIKNKITLKSLVQNYQQYLPIDTIYQLYAQNSPWGAPKETLAQVKAGQYAD